MGHPLSITMAIAIVIEAIIAEAVAIVEVTGLDPILSVILRS